MGLLPLVGHTQLIRVISFNIRYDNPADGADAWPLRKTDVAMYMQDHEFSIIGMQEVLHHQLMFLDSALTDFDYVGVGRDDGKELGEYSPIFYRSSELDLLNTGTFWLSKTPEMPSKDRDAALPRICTWCVLRNKLLNVDFLVMNTHFDHIGVESRKNAALLILEKMKILSDNGQMPVVLLGDFNVDFKEESINLLCENLSNVYLKTGGNEEEPVPTFNAFRQDYSEGKMIDHIFTQNAEAISFHVADDVRTNGRFLSDHFPVIALLQLHLKKKKN
ncbi:MAG: endonuclease/exonuclease/phosphatase family protein [Flavobacteriales bacterium]|nr:endonuclease/exonuclease/phosphatase family protein [Flavobacteriales bacterium]